MKTEYTAAVTMVIGPPGGPVERLITAEILGVYPTKAEAWDAMRSARMLDVACAGVEDLSVYRMMVLPGRPTREELMLTTTWEMAYSPFWRRLP